MEAESCETCRFWRVIRTGSIGTCHRLPPSVYVDDMHEVESAFPRTLSEEWCGEWSSYADEVEEMEGT